MEMMNWDDLRIFLAVARQGTLAQAAARLAIDPTTVARRVQRLESSLGATLFEHTPLGHVLTTRGTALLDQAQMMEEAMVAATERGGSAKGIADGTIRVSVSEGFGSGIIAPNLVDFSSAHPGIVIELVASTGFLNPSRREADIAIMLARPKRGPLIVRKLTDYGLGLYGRRDRTDISSLSALSEHRMIGYVPDLIYSPELRYLDDVPGNLSASLTSTSVNAQVQLVGSGAGIGILPCFIADRDPALQRFLSEEIDIHRAFWLVIHRDMRGIARIRLFIDWLDELVAKLRPLFIGLR
jgi:DNA-binding transcriptional LysR family regulator